MQINIKNLIVIYKANYNKLKERLFVSIEIEIEYKLDIVTIHYTKIKLKKAKLFLYTKIA